MKKFILSIVAVAALVALPMGAKAQDINSTVNDVNAAAKIITPIKLVLTAGSKLDFGTITSPEAADVIKVTAENVRSATNSEILLSSGSSSVPEFTVSGEVGQAFTITLPKDGDIMLNGGSSYTMAVNSFITNNTATAIVSGGSKFKIGASLTVAAGQTAGSYTATFPVTVSYN
jgi:hypothetical protein